jgi:diaminopimelate epimerase
MSGAGNDFVVVDRTGSGGLRGLDDPPALARSISDRRSGVGADGLIVLGPPPSGADFTMDYFNADGSTGSLCGNGGRCAAAYMMDRLGRDAVTFHTLGKAYRARRKGRDVVLEMDNPGPLRSGIRLGGPRDAMTGHFIDTGSPHVVIARDGGLPGTREVYELGREIRHHPEFQPSGTNVDFIAAEGEDIIRIRTYERGVEDETRACGTGAVAAAMVYAVLRGGEGERSIGVIPLSGERLVVTFRRSGERFTGVSLEGPAIVTFTGSFDTGPV